MGLSGRGHGRVQVVGIAFLLEPQCQAGGEIGQVLLPPSVVWCYSGYCPSGALQRLVQFGWVAVRLIGHT